MLPLGEVRRSVWKALPALFLTTAYDSANTSIFFFKVALEFPLWLSGLLIWLVSVEALV